MLNQFKKNWITFLGVFFVFMSFLYFLKLAFDSGWVPPVGRAAIGLTIGLSGLFAGYSLFRKHQSLSSEVIAGLGMSVMYATFAYASFSDQIRWSVNTLFISMISLSSLVTYVSYRFNMRALISLSIIGGLITPIVIKANPDQDMVLFLYVLVLNVASLYLSAVKKWHELRIISFVATVVIFCSYYIYFDPEHWTRPFFYVSSLFFVYVIGLISASWYEKDRFEGLNLYLGMINAIHYVFWSIFILNAFTLSYTIPMMIVGLVFIAAGTIIFKISKEATLPVGLYYLLGIVVLAIAVGDLGTLFATPGMNYVVNASMWLALACFVVFVGELIKQDAAKYIGIGIWGITMIHWYAVAWDVEWVRWFGVKYIPFINPGALVWMGLATSGFIFSRIMLKKAKRERDRSISTLLAIASHAVIGGLLTLQIDNVWEAYNVTAIKLSLVLSIVWFFYALLLFLWGAYTKSIIFKRLGTIVIVVSSFKVIFFDLQGEDSLYKVLSLFIIGVLTLGIAYVNSRWSDSDIEVKNHKD